MISQLFYRISNKIKRDAKKKIWNTVPWLEDVTFKSGDEGWYDPFLTGPSTFVDKCSSADTIKNVINIIQNLESDKFLNYNLAFYKKGLETFGSQWRYADITTVLYAICSLVNIKNYLEIGVRRGRSMSVVGSVRPDVAITGFDMWIQNYAGLENPGESLVRKELRKVGHKGSLEFFNGNSQVTVPAYFKQFPNNYFDLVTVDGDHTKRGALLDLKNVLPYIKIGGFLIFDDICNPELPYMKSIWNKLIENNDNFVSYSFDESGFGTAFAIRRA